MFGSQAILASFRDGELPDEAIGSIEADVCFRHDHDDAKADKVDGAIGELSSFHESFGIYAQGVSLSTALLPTGWESRVVVLTNPNTAPGRGLCLEPHDLVASKLAAGRQKDFEFARALLHENLIDSGILARRIAALPVGVRERDRLHDWIAARTR